MSTIEQIIRAINLNGRQGPRDLRSREVYGWVKKGGINIGYQNYLAQIARHSIPDSERAFRRDAYFVCDDSGYTSFFKSREKELRPYVCAVIADEPGLTSKAVRRRVKLIYQNVTPIDIMLQLNISSPQEVIDQTIRNILVSNYDREDNSKLLNRSSSKPYTYTLTKEGKKLAKTVALSVADDEPEQEQAPVKAYKKRELATLRAAQKTAPPKAVAARGRVYFPSDARLKATRKQMSDFRCEIDADHPSFTTDAGEFYAEGHHILPMAAQKCFPAIHLDCLENLITLCPLCHRAVHYGSADIKAKILGKIFAARAQDFAGMGFSKKELAELIRLFYGCELSL